ncbi:hypothetical protein Tsubulata_029632, partial [Turnera subulata]
NTTWDERYDVSLNTNAQGPGRLLEFAKKCKKLKLVLHVSTAFINGERQGVFREKPLCSQENTPVPFLDVNSELKLALDTVESYHGSETIQKLKELGTRRAKSYGWRNSYEMSK